MRPVHDLFADYEAHHQRLGNQLTHYLGIPTLAVCLLGLGAKVELLALAGGWSLDVGLLLALALTITYLAWHPGLGLAMGVLLGLAYLAGRPLPAPWLWAGLAVGVFLQYLGHYAFEGRSPAFHKNLVHTLVGPLWVGARLLRGLGLYRASR